MASDIPPFLQVGTPVSAKFKGAFCEATIKSIKKFVKCKVVYKDISGSSIVSDENITGDLQLNAHVQVKQENGDLKEATIQKMNDHSQYTVVFDDGDERTLRRTNVFVMGEKHFQEHENLDNLPLTDPENFLSPVVMHADKRRKRKRSQPHLDEEDSDSDGVRSSKRWNESDKQFLGKVVCVEQGERKKTWFPALGLKHFGSHPDNQIYVQSFKDGKKLLVKKSDVKEFSKTKEPILGILKGEIKTDPILRVAMDKALAYHDMGELPKGWNILDTIDEKDDSSDEESHTGPTVPLLTPAEKSFQDTIYNFLNSQGTPVTKSPMINNQGVVLQKLYNHVVELGGYEEVTNPQWRTIYKQMGLLNMHTTTSFNMKNIYKKFLLAYEEQNRPSVKSPGSSKSGRPRRSNTNKDLSIDNDKSSTISESDSEPDRRRTTRSSRTLLEKSLEKSLDSQNRIRRSNLNLTDISLADDGGDKSTCSSKDLGNVNELDMKSEVEDIDVVNSPESSVTSEETEQVSKITVANAKYKAGSKISVRYGSGKNLRYYTAKILEVDREENEEVLYYIHYNGWNRRYNEWIKDERITGLSTDISTKKKNAAPPTPITKIAKDPPARYKAKLDCDSLSATSKTSSENSDQLNQKPEKPTSIPILEKPPSPIKSPTSFNPDTALYTSEQIPNKSSNLRTPRFRSNVADSLIIPDIKPSPIKPRMTRNSMQDTFLLNALEESIGKGNQAAMNLQADILMKSEHSASSARRRSHRQTSQHSQKLEDQTEEKDDTSIFKKEDVVVKSASDADVVNPLDVTSIDHLKLSSREDSVKKWIEDSNKVLSSATTSHGESSKHEIDEKVDDSNDDVNLSLSSSSNNTQSKCGRKPKLRKVDDDSTKRKTPGSDEEENTDDEMKTEKIPQENDNTSITIPVKSEKVDETSAHTALSDFCNIVDSVNKLDSSEWNAKSDLSKTEVTRPTPTKEEKPKRQKHKRKRSKSFVDDESETKSPRKEKKGSQELKYNVDFMSDLSDILKDKDPVERINIMQERLNSMRELYMKLRTEVASIDRRRRRKNRKQ